MNDLISRSWLLDVFELVPWDTEKDRNRAIHHVRELAPSAEPQIIRCRDCKYFEFDHWENVKNIPLIVAHEICTKWGAGCKTSADGYCFMAEKEDQDGQN